VCHPPLNPYQSCSVGHARSPTPQIQHAPIRGVTSAMVSWWFRNIDGEAEVDGVIYPRFLLWHPRDHVSKGTVYHGPTDDLTDAVWRIVEFYNATTGEYSVG